ncbi:MAG: hypothetical protein ACOVOR_00335 [Rhabdochlamydiaceae bacterium]
MANFTTFSAFLSDPSYVLANNAPFFPDKYQKIKDNILLAVFASSAALFLAIYRKQVQFSFQNSTLFIFREMTQMATFQVAFDIVIFWPDKKIKALQERRDVSETYLEKLQHISDPTLAMRICLVFILKCIEYAYLKNCDLSPPFFTKKQILIGQLIIYVLEKLNVKVIFLFKLVISTLEDIQKKRSDNIRFKRLVLKNHSLLSSLIPSDPCFDEQIGKRFEQKDIDKILQGLVNKEEHVLLDIISADNKYHDLFHGLLENEIPFKNIQIEIMVESIFNNYSYKNLESLLNLLKKSDNNYLISVIQKTSKERIVSIVKNPYNTRFFSLLLNCDGLNLLEDEDFSISMIRNIIISKCDTKLSCLLQKIKDPLKKQNYSKFYDFIQSQLFEIAGDDSYFAIFVEIIYTPFINLAKVNKNNDDLVGHILKRKAQKNFHSLLNVIKVQKDPNIALFLKEKIQKYVLSLSAKDDRYELFRLILEQPYIKLHQKNSKNQGIIHYIIKYRCLNNFKLIVNHINKDPDGLTYRMLTEEIYDHFYEMARSDTYNEMFIQMLKIKNLRLNKRDEIGEGIVSYMFLGKSIKNFQTLLDFVNTQKHHPDTYHLKTMVQESLALLLGIENQKFHEKALEFLQ